MTDDYKIPPMMTAVRWNPLITILDAFLALINLPVGDGITFLGDLEVISKVAKLSCAAPALTNQQILDDIYHYTGNTWDPYGLPTGSSVLTFKDITTNNYANLFLVISSENNNNPLLTVDSGFIVKKDVQAGGFIGSDQGAIILGHGLLNSTDPAKILLSHGYLGYDTLYIEKLNNDLSTSDGNLRLATLTASLGFNLLSPHNTISLTFGDNGAGQDSYIIPNAGVGLGTATYPFKWLDATTVATNTLNSISATGITVSDFLRLTYNSSATRLISSGSGILKIQDDSGNAGILDISNLFVDHIVGLSGDGITFLDYLKFTDLTHAWITMNYIYGAADAPYSVAWRMGTGSDLDFYRNSATDTIIATYSKGDGYNRFKIDGNGTFAWGTGSSTQDTRLYRINPGVLEVQAYSSGWVAGTLDVSNLFVDHINSLSGGPITLYQPFTDVGCSTGSGGIQTNHIVSISGDNTVIMATRANSYAVFGVAAASTTPAQVITFGRAQVVAGETLVAGDRVTCDDNSHAIKFNSWSLSLSGISAGSESSHTHALNQATSGVNMPGGTTTVVNYASYSDVASSTHAHTISHTHNINGLPTSGPAFTNDSDLYTHYHNTYGNTSDASPNTTSGVNMPGGTTSVVTGIGTTSVASSGHSHNIQTPTLAGSAHTHTISGGNTSTFTTGEVTWKVLVGATTGNLATVYIK